MPCAVKILRISSELSQDFAPRPPHDCDVGARISCSRLLRGLRGNEKQPRPHDIRIETPRRKLHDATQSLFSLLVVSQAGFAEQPQQDRTLALSVSTDPALAVAWNQIFNDIAFAEDQLCAWLRFGSFVEDLRQRVGNVFALEQPLPQ